MKSGFIGNFFGALVIAGASIGCRSVDTGHYIPDDGETVLIQAGKVYIKADSLNNAHKQLWRGHTAKASVERCGPKKDGCQACIEFDKTRYGPNEKIQLIAIIRNVKSPYVSEKADVADEQAIAVPITIGPTGMPIRVWDSRKDNVLKRGDERHDTFQDKLKQTIGNTKFDNIIPGMQRSYELRLDTLYDFAPGHSYNVQLDCWFESAGKKHLVSSGIAVFRIESQR